MTRTDNFGNDVSNPMTDLLDIPGEKDFTPERLRVYRNSSRIYLQYGTDSHYSETKAGHLLSPDGGDTMRVETAERISYPVGFDIVASMAWEVPTAPQSGDVVTGGFGNPDADNFDPAAESYSGSTADGYFWYLTEDTGLTEAVFAEVRGGTILYSRRAELGKPADVWKRFAQWVNWYDVGPCRFIETYTDIDEEDVHPQQNRPLAAVANDDGKGPEHGSKRIGISIHQDSANSGLTVEMGSIGCQVPGRFDYLFKDKTHTMSFDVSNTADDTYEVLGAIRTDPNRPLIKAKINDATILSTPSSSTEVEVQVISVDPDSTNLVDGDFATPRVHNPKNSVIEAATSTSATGPDLDAAGTDATGAATAETMTNPGGYQIIRDTIGTVGSGSKTTQHSSGKTSSRTVYDTDWALVLIDSNEAGTHEVDFITAQNN